MKMKSCMPIMLAVWPYLALALINLPTGENEIISTFIFIALIVLTVAIYTANLVNACTHNSMDDAYHLAFWNMMVKLIHIPFYVMCFILGILLLFAAVIPGLIFVTPFVVLGIVVIDFLLMVGTSAYGINALVRAKKKGSVSPGFVTVNTILHLFFVADVISAIVVFAKMKSNKNKNINMNMTPNMNMNPNTTPNMNMNPNMNVNSNMNVNPNTNQNMNMNPNMNRPWN